MRTFRRAAALAMAGILALGVTACTDDEADDDIIEGDDGVGDEDVEGDIGQEDDGEILEGE